ncbi:MAG: alpha-E domain-containing protein [Verrucomicrobiota bacterium]
MLCRVADSLFWMSRYIERAENTARLIEVNLQLLVETHYAEEADLEDHWKPILESTGDLALFQQKHARCDSRSVTEFTTFDLENPSSVLSCLSAARENARAVRDQISPEMWEILNRLYLNLRSSDSKRVWKRGPAQFYQEIKEYSHLFQGVTEATFPHRAGYEFIKAGKFLERADKTSRILGLKHLFERYGDHATGGMVDIGQWIAILSACSALEPYHRAYVASGEARNVIAFLLQSRDFPRSVLFCLSQLQLAIHAISGCPTTHYSNEAERFCGRLISDLNYAVTEEIMDGGLDTFLDHAQETIDKIALQLSQRYMFFPIVDPASAVMEQKMS